MPRNVNTRLSCFDYFVFVDSRVFVHGCAATPTALLNALSDYGKWVVDIYCFVFIDSRVFVHGCATTPTALLKALTVGSGWLIFIVLYL